MTLVINNQDVARLLTMDVAIEVLENTYRELASEEAVCRPRIDIRIPTSDPTRNYQWGTMEGGSASGYFAVRMKSDIIYEENRGGVIAQKKYCTKPGVYCGLVLLTSVETGEPLAFINDGVLQHMRVAGDGAIGVKYMANEDAEVVGMLGSGGMAHAHMQAFMAVRNIKKLQVFSPTKENRQTFCREMASRYNIEVTACDRPEDIYKGAHIVAGLTDSAVPVLDGSLLEKGTHIINIGGGNLPDAASIARVDVYLRFGDTPSPVGRPDIIVTDEMLAWEARPSAPKFGVGRREGQRKTGIVLPDKRITLADIFNGRSKGRTSPDQITWSERGNLQGGQFYGIGGRVYELAKQAGLGYEIPTELFLQDIRN
jgi:ornithine cyclodeaminase/alanine dehydrogenase-like protein (mu-crystallin family)